MNRCFLSGIRKSLAALLAVGMLLASAGVAESTEEREFRKIPLDIAEKGADYTADRNTNPNYYEDPTIRVDIARVEYTENKYGVIYFYAIVKIQDPSQLRTTAGDEKNFIRGVRQRSEKMAKWKNAVLALNGDFCTPGVRAEGSKYCLRQGVVYRDTVVENLDMLLIDEDADFHIYKAGPELAELDKTEIDGKKIVNAFQFGPALVIDGEPVDDEYILDANHSPWSAEPYTHAQRMCFGQIDKLTYLVLCCWDGLDLVQLRDLVQEIAPCKTLYVLDGGNSAQLVYLKRQFNLKGKHEDAPNARTIADIIYFASAYFEKGK